MSSPVIKKSLLSRCLIATMFLASPALFPASAVDSVEAWKEQARAQIAAQQVYPKSAVSQKLEGKVELLLDLTAAGHLKSVKILETSGHTILDKTAMGQILSIDKLPALPEGAESGTLLVPLNFTL